MRALVTGAAGFVGAALARRLVADGHEVHALVHPRSDIWRLEGVEARIHPIDLAEEPAVGDVVDRVRPEWIFHLAAHGAYPSQSDFRAMVRTNVLGTIHLVESCLRIGFDALVNTGSSSEYGFTDHAPSEDEEPRPASNYAVTKLTATLYCRAAAAPSGHSIPTRAWDTSVGIANRKKIERELGWRPRTTFEEGFSRFARWLSENPDRLQVYRDRAASNLSRLSQSRR